MVDSIEDKNSPPGTSKAKRIKYSVFVLIVGISLTVAHSIIIKDSLQKDSVVQDTLVAKVKSDKGPMDETYPSWMDEIVAPPKGVAPEDVYSFSCELVLREPEAFTTACADFGEAVFDVKWTEWGAAGSKGKGIYSVNDCEPSCAEGTRYEIPVFVWLKDVSTNGRFYFFNTLQIVPRDVYTGRVNEVRSNYARLTSSVIIEGKTFTGAEWDLSRDWKEFPELRSELPK